MQLQTEKRLEQYFKLHIIQVLNYKDIFAPNHASNKNYMYK